MTAAARILVVLLAAAAIRPLPAQTKAARDFDKHFKKYSKRYFGPFFDWRYFKAQAYAESNLDPEAKSWVGARGVMQLMPATYEEIQLKNPEIGDIGDPEWNIAAGILYDRTLWKQWDGKAEDTVRLRFVFGSYNAGLRTIRRAESIAEEASKDTGKWESIEEVAPAVPKWRFAETLGYVRKIHGNYHGIRSQRSKIR